MTIVEKEEIYQDTRKAPAFTKLESRQLPSKPHSKVLGLDINQWMVVVVVVLVSLILYSVLLLLTVRAARCLDTLETIMEQRKEWMRKVVDGKKRGD